MTISRKLPHFLLGIFGPRCCFHIHCLQRLAGFSDGPKRSQRQFEVSQRPWLADVEVEIASAQPLTFTKPDKNGGRNATIGLTINMTDIGTSIAARIVGVRADLIPFYFPNYGGPMKR